MRGYFGGYSGTAAATLACIVAALRILAAQEPVPGQVPDRVPACEVSGIATAGTSRLPGVAITIAPATGTAPTVTSTGLDGRYLAPIPGPGAYTVRAELPAFAPVVREITVDASCRARLDVQLSLASRVQGAPPAAQPIPMAPASRSAARAGPFQRATPASRGAGAGLQAPGTLQGESAGTDDAAVASHLSLPPGFSADALADPVAAFGSTGQTNDALLFAGGREGMFGREEIMAMGGIAGIPGMGAGPGAAMPAGGFPGGFDGQGAFGGGRGGLGMGDAGGMRPGMAGGLGGMAGGRGGFMGDGPGGRGGPGGPGGLGGRLGIAAQQLNTRPRGQFSYTLAGSPLDARPYSLTGQPTAKPQYLQQRFAASIGGPLKIPKLFDAGPRTTFFLNYTGNHSSNLFTRYSTVPTLAERAGDFSALSAPLIDPSTGQPFPGNQIPASRISPTAQALLAQIPVPNQPGAAQNYYFATTAATSTDDVNFRFIRSFGETSRPQRGGGQARGRGGAMGRGGSVNLNLGVHYHRSKTDQPNAFPTLTGTNQQTGWAIPLGVSFPLWGGFNSANVSYNRNNATTTNAFAFVNDVAGNAGITGISADPFDWGVPNLSFSSVTGLTDVSPSRRADRTLTFSDTLVRSWGRHNVRFGGNFSDVRVDSRTDATARGAFVFTGLYTGGGMRAGGFDVADFLLGMAQQGSVQYGPGVERFRSRSWSLYAQDDWRVRTTLTLNAGVRYEYQSPYWEANERLVNLDVTSGFTSAVPVVAGGTGPFTGAFPATLVNPDRNNVAPRIGVAWRPTSKTMVRGGYGINYASVPYLSFAQRLAGQPPFAVTDTVLGTVTSPVALTDAFAGATTASTTNNFGVDRNYQLGYVQIWNVDLQRDVSRTLTLGAGYIGTRGSDLDLLRAPNRGPSGLRIAGVQPFIWESSGASSIMHSLSLRANRRLAQGLAGGVVYTLSRSRDNASSLSGSGGVVAQNDQDLRAEWGLSSFDQRHRLSANASYELPFGPNRRWLSGGGWAAQVFGGWMVSASLAASSGTPYTARVLGDVADVSRGTNGTLRADYTGAMIAVANPTIDRFFNTAAFAIPAPGTFGTAGRNTIIGPGSTNLNMALQKTFPMRGTRGLSLRAQATNLLNRAQWAAIDTVVNSPTFGQVTSVRPMRSVQLIARVMF